MVVGRMTDRIIVDKLPKFDEIIEFYVPTEFVIYKPGHHIPIVGRKNVLNLIDSFATNAETIFNQRNWCWGGASKHIPTKKEIFEETLRLMTHEFALWSVRC